MYWRLLFTPSTSFIRCATDALSRLEKACALLETDAVATTSAKANHIVGARYGSRCNDHSRNVDAAAYERSVARRNAALPCGPSSVPGGSVVGGSGDGGAMVTGGGS